MSNTAQEPPEEVETEAKGFWLSRLGFLGLAFWLDLDQQQVAEILFPSRRAFKYSSILVVDANRSNKWNFHPSIHYTLSH